MNVIQKFLKSLYSPVYIGRFRFIGVGKTIGYIFFLMLIMSIPAGIYLTNHIFSTTQHLEYALEEHIPDFTLENGILSSEHDKPQQFEVEDETIYFDPTGELSREDIEKESNVTALLQEEIVIYTGDDIQSFRYDNFGDIQVSKSNVLSIIKNINQSLPILIPIILALLYLFSTGMKFIGVLFLSLYGLLIKKMAPIPLSYRQIWIMCAYSITLPTVVSTALDMLPIQAPNTITAMYWLISFAMLFYVYKKLPKPRR